MKNKTKSVEAKPGAGRGLRLLRRSVEKYPDDPRKAKLETFSNPYPLRDYWVHFECPEFTSLCPITGHPDFGLITIDYIPDKLCLESKSLKLYLFTYRNAGAFYENVVNRIAEAIAKTCRPRRLKLIGKFNPRGGISITVSVEYP